jgi:hypothetical protein
MVTLGVDAASCALLAEAAATHETNAAAKNVPRILQNSE